MNMDTILQGYQQFLIGYWNTSPIHTKVIITVFLLLFISISILKIWDILVSSNLKIWNILMSCKDWFKKLLSRMYVGYDNDYHLYLKIIDTPERAFSEKVSAVEQIIEISIRQEKDLPKKLCMKLLSDFKESEKIYTFHYQLVDYIKKSEGGDLSHQTLFDISTLYGPPGLTVSSEHACFIDYLVKAEITSPK